MSEPDPRAGVGTDALRLAVGTLTVLRVPPPRRVDARVGGAAMTLAPLVGLGLGLAAAAAGLLAELVGLSPLLCAVLAIGAVALLTRGLHLDGLADTADGLGSGRRGADALAVMSRSDIGPFGVVTLLLVLLVQVAALTQLWAAAHGPAAVIVMAVVSRAALPVLCSRWFRAAKRDGLGSAVAGSVGPAALGLALTVTTLVAVLVGATATATATASAVAGALAGGAALVAGLAAATALGARCVRRFGGVTGDVLGGGVEAAATVALLVLAATLT